MLISKIPVLESGYVALIDTSLNKAKQTELLSLVDLPKDKLNNISTVCVIVKCPIAMHCVLSQINGASFIIANKEDEEEYYLPTEADIGASDLATSKHIQEDMMNAVGALVNNREAYKADGAIPEVAGMLTPVNKYITVLMSAPYNIIKASCDNMLSYNNTIIKQYAIAIEQILTAEF